MLLLLFPQISFFSNVSPIFRDFTSGGEVVFANVSSIWVVGVVIDVRFPMFVVESTLVSQVVVSRSNVLLPSFPPANCFVIRHMPTELVFMSLHVSSNAHSESEDLSAPLDVLIDNSLFDGFFVSNPFLNPRGTSVIVVDF